MDGVDVTAGEGDGRREGGRRVPHVAVLVETSRSYGRGVLRGIRRYVSERGPWSVFMELRDLRSPAPPWLAGWQGDGILTRSGSQAMADAVRAAGVPAVELRSTRLDHGLPFVGIDNAAIGRMVAEHLLERGFRSFGLYELRSERFFEQRCAGFVAAVREAGCEAAVYTAGEREQPAQWERQQAELAAWVRTLAKPAGVMACNDQLGYWLLDACRRAGVSVPEEVAVVGVENEQSLCEMADPPLSSVAFNAVGVGYAAAALLDRMMRGEREPEAETLVPPMGIVTRPSSDIVAIDDAELAAALRLIRERACEGIDVDDVLEATTISRSSLERRMRAKLGRTPREEIQRVRLRWVRRLLAETDMTLAAVAERCGFRHPQYLAEVFKRDTGQTPGAYRRAARGGG